ncbi:hypothetical protein D3C72_1298410 [compost metagenome]
MKTVLMTLVLAFSANSFAWISTSPTSKEYSFKFDLDGNKHVIKRSAASYEDAYKSAAKECFNYYKGSGKLSEDRGLDIIDVCANPRS